MPPIPPGYVLVTEAAAQTQNSADTIRQWIRKGQLPHVRHFRRLYVPLDQVTACRSRTNKHTRSSHRIPSSPPAGLVTTRHAHDVTQISMRTIQHLAASGRIKATKYNHNWYVSLDDLHTYAKT